MRNAANPFSLVDGGVPRVAGAAGLDGRFHYWFGASRRRYLFTQVSASELGDFGDAPLVLARIDDAGRVTGEDVLLLGAGDSPERAGIVARLAADARLVAFVHLLAPNAAARCGVVADLRGVSDRLAA